MTGIIHSVNATSPPPASVIDPTLLTTAVDDMEIAHADAGRMFPDFIDLGAGLISGLTLVPVRDFSFAAPLSAIDHLEVHEHEGRLTFQATKTITANDPHMEAHFPDFTIFPGVFILEGLRQGVISALGEFEGLLPEIHSVRALHFSAPLLPGDQMSLDAIIEPASTENSFEVVACCRRNDGAIAARLKVEFGYGRTGVA